MSDTSTTPIRYIGFDSAAEVFAIQGRIFRGIYPGNSELYRDVLRICKIYNLFQYGIVPTEESKDDSHQNLPYELVLEHKRVPFITYPHEWTASMLKDAALFHLELYNNLSKYGLTLKDWHPYNILFDSTKPIFIDFTSVIPHENLFNEAYLTPTRTNSLIRHTWDATSLYIHEMYKRMCLPYFVLPLYLMHSSRHNYARQRLLQTAINTSRTTITEGELFTKSPQGYLRYKLADIAKRGMLIQPGKTKDWFWTTLRSEIHALSVKPKTSGYSDYYSEKGEDFTFEPSPHWTSKQHAVYNAIKQFNPTTVLDIGSNTGWFSILAARYGSKVVALDIDESCADILYHRAKRDNLAILPLVSDITKPTPDVLPLTYENESAPSALRGSTPILLASTKRLKCDMVLALAIVHHLALGIGMDFSQIVNRLASHSGHWLLVEFISKEDDLITNEPSFFPSYNKNPQKYEWYKLDQFINQLKKRFQHVQPLPSHPDTRTIIICSR